MTDHQYIESLSLVYFPCKVGDNPIYELYQWLKPGKTQIIVKTNSLSEMIVELAARGLEISGKYFDDGDKYFRVRRI